MRTWHLFDIILQGYWPVAYKEKKKKAEKREDTSANWNFVVSGSGVTYSGFTVWSLKKYVLSINILGDAKEVLIVDKCCTATC